MKYINLIIFIIFGIILPNENNIKYDYVMDSKIVTNIEKIDNKQQNIEKNVLEENRNIILNTYYGDITAYTPNCLGCIGITASSYDVKNTIYYEDNTYNTIRIVAADKSIPFGSIIRISEIDIIAIVLDRGGSIGFDSGVIVDLLFSNEKEAYEFGRISSSVEILRYGY